MAAKVRVYELARELGLENKEAIDLCQSLGIDAKSHSSSMVEAQADRVRRKAHREGLVRETQPEPAEEPKKAPAKKKPAAKKAAVKKAPVEAPASKPATAPASTTPAAPAGDVEFGGTGAPVERPTVPPHKARKVFKSSGTSGQPDAPAAPAPAAKPVPPRPVPPRPVPPRPAPPRAPAAAQKPPAKKAPPAEPAPKPIPPHKVRQMERDAAERKIADDAAAVKAAEAAKVAEAATAAAAKAAAEAPPEATPPRGPGGKPIPPPPGGPPRSQTGKAIPPPPPGRNAPPPRGVGVSRGPSRPGGSPSGAGAGRPAGPGGGGPGGRPGGGPPGRGRGGPQRRPPRRRGGGRRRKREELRPHEAPSYTPTDAPVPTGEVLIERGSTPQDLAERLNRTAADVVRFLLMQGEMVTATQALSDDMIELFAAEVGAGIRLVNRGEEQEEELKKVLEIDDFEEYDDEDFEPRPPVITVMGHVDHGKTLLLDRIREANVVAGEAGGITQHIGAYQVERQGRMLTFIDTPGHEAFTAMRARGADATDIVILMVAADDGVMPQTIEAINHAKAADVPIVVAVNKIDRDNADPDRVYSQLAEHELVPEEWGGETIVCKISALKNEGIEDLLDNLIVVADLEELTGIADGRAMGVVLESHLDVGRGPVATVLVQHGVLSVGDPMVAGAAWGRVRALINDKGEQVKTAGPSTPVEVLGLSDVAESGDEFTIAPSEKVASKVADTRDHWQRQASLVPANSKGGGARLEDLFAQIKSGEAATLNLIVKADVHGSLEALTSSLQKLERDEVKLAFVHRGVGGITENDVQLASAANATIIGFNVRPDRKARTLAIEEDVEIRTYEIIYEILEEIEKAMLGMLAPEYEEVVTGEAEVREIFRVPKIGAIAGCLVQNGVITRGSKVRFLREGVIIWKGDVSSLKRFKDDVREVQAGFECGIGLSDYQDLKPGDIIETFEDKEIPVT